MCIGTPYEIIETDGWQALCRGRSGTARIDLSLVGPQPRGTWLVCHRGAARLVVTAEDAARIADALEALERVHAGEGFDDLFADLIDREPELPPHLRSG